MHYMPVFSHGLVGYKMSYSVSAYQQTLLFCGVVDYLSKETQHFDKETLTLLLHLKLKIDWGWVSRTGTELVPVPDWAVPKY